MKRLWCIRPGCGSTGVSSCIRSGFAAVGKTLCFRSGCGTAGGYSCCRSGCGSAEWCYVPCKAVGELVCTLSVPGQVVGQLKDGSVLGQLVGELRMIFLCQFRLAKQPKDCSVSGQTAKQFKTTSCTISDCGTSSRVKPSHLQLRALDWFFSVVISRFYQ